MLSLSKTTGYAIEALSHLGEPGARPASLRTIAAQARVPYAYLAKRMPDLVAAGLVQSLRGKRGGVRLGRAPETITLLEISQAVEARHWLGRCLLGLETCTDERSCPAHQFWKEARQQIEIVLRTTTLADVIAHEKNRRAARE